MPLPSYRTDSVIIDWLKQLRSSDGTCLPPSEYLARLPISLQADSRLWQAYLRQAALPVKSLAGYHIAIDLDETLLLNSHACPQLWHLGRGYQDKAIYPAYCYQRMRKTWRGRLQRLRGRTHYDTADRNAYPFLRHPRQIVMPRPGMLAGLEWLTQQGVRLTLITTSAPERVTYLLECLPQLKYIFAHRVITAREIAAYYLALEREGRAIADACSRQAYRQRPRSLAIKTPDLVNWVLGQGSYNLIADDSERMASVFGAADLHDRLLWVRPDWPVSSYGMQIVAAIARRLSERAPKPPANASQPLPLDSSWDNKNAVQKACVRLEDPYYWPLRHLDDRLPELPTGWFASCEDQHD